ncbi:MAG: hypothetical protein ACQEQC_05680, partial [Elusimicrobiota bacterium]
MEFEERVKKLSKRVSDFLEVNEEVDIIKLKFHLNCKGSQLLVALGILLKEDKLTLTENRGNIIISSR